MCGVGVARVMERREDILDEKAKEQLRLLAQSRDMPYNGRYLQLIVVIRRVWHKQTQDIDETACRVSLYALVFVCNQISVNELPSHGLD